MMNDEQLLRYSRHILLEDFDVSGQEALLSAKVLLLGCGGLGASAGLYLASSGIGDLSVADGDIVELSNLQRQILFRERDQGLPKADVSAAVLADLNRGISLRPIYERLTGERLVEEISRADLVLDASDNFATRCEVNAACLALSKPLVSGAAIRAEGQLIVFDSREPDSPCYRCLYKQDMEDDVLRCSESGVLAPLVGVIGSMMAVEAIRMLVGFGAKAVGRLTIYDARNQEWRQLRVERDRFCMQCGS